MSLMRPMLQSVSGNTVTIVQGSFDTSDIYSIVYSGVKFDSDGNQYKRQSNGGWSSMGSWLQMGTAGSFYVHRTVESGALTTNDGTALVLSTDRVYDCQDVSIGGGPVVAVVEFTLSTSVTPGVGELVTKTLSFSANKETDQ